MPSMNAGVYSIHKMVPPGTHYYFMSVNGEEYHLNNGAMSASISESQSNLINEKLERNPAYSFIMKKTFNLTKINYVESEFQRDPLRQQLA